MIQETSGNNYEDARSLQQDLTFKYTGAYFKKKKVSFANSQKRTLGLIGNDGTFTNLAMLLSDQCAHTLKLAAFEGAKKTVFRDRKELTGSLLAQLEGAFAYIDQFNHTRAEFSGLDRIDQRDYPAAALREALLNAIVHRDYSMGGPTLVSIFDDRIEIVTIGGLPRGITYADMMLGVSVPRNPHLANVFYRLRLVEAYGTGLLKINESYANCQVKPQIEVTDNAFKITLPNRNFAHPALQNAECVTCHTTAATSVQTPASTSRENIILNLLRRQQTITRKDAQTELGLSQATTSLILRKMVENKLITKQGSGKYITYTLNLGQ
jgi:ATP-dependent DNA helicase RecG